MRPRTDVCAPPGEPAFPQERKQTMKREGKVVILATALFLATGVASAASDAGKCAAAKSKIAGKYYFCLQKAEAKAILKETLPDYSKCAQKFDEKWNLAETGGAGMCPDNVATSPMSAYFAARAAEAAAIIRGADDIPSLGSCGELLVSGQTQCENGGAMVACPGNPAGVQDGDTQYGRPRQYTDNGDGTITDEVTDLVWEKLCDQDPAGVICPADHDVDSGYTWVNAFTKIANMNAANYAGHSDWRLPNVRELESLAERGRVNPAIDPTFASGCLAPCDTVACSCTRQNYYWSSTSAQGNPGFAWLVVFTDGVVGTGNKINANYVRAVRGGS
jgi:hypothetical protein